VSPKKPRTLQNVDLSDHVLDRWVTGTFRLRGRVHCGRTLPRSFSSARVLAVVIGAVAAVPVALAGGSRTEVVRFEIDDTAPDPTTSEFCGFPVETHFEGFFVIKTTFSGPSASRFHQVSAGGFTLDASAPSLVAQRQVISQCPHPRIKFPYVARP
jgi:hypothetical protein